MQGAVQQERLFEVGATRAVLLALDDAPALQQFFDANPDYFLTVSGQVAGPDAAREQLAGDVPEEFSYTKQLAIGFFDQDAHLTGVADVVCDLLTPGVWHIGLFMVAARKRGLGLGTALYQALEAWIEAGGARWIRLGVVIGNAAAERFWERQNFTEMMVRRDVLMEGKLNQVRVMVKPLGANQLGDYRKLVLRDQPTSA